MIAGSAGGTSVDLKLRIREATPPSASLYVATAWKDRTPSWPHVPPRLIADAILIGEITSGVIGTEATGNMQTCVVLPGRGKPAVQP